MTRGEVWVADFGPPRGSAPAYQRPALVVSADRFNRVSIRTVVTVAITTNIGYARIPGNVFLPAGTAGLAQDSVANVSQIATLDKTDLETFLGVVPRYLIARIEMGLRLVLSL